MELILENPIFLKKSIEIISDIVSEGTFVFKPDFIELVALNNNNVVMVVFRLLAINFEKYDIGKEKQITLSLEHLNSILKSCDNKAKLSLIIEDLPKLKLISNGKSKKEFEISLIEFDTEDIQKIPNLDFPLKIVTTSNQLTSAINDLGFVEEALTFRVLNKKFSIDGKTNSMAGKVNFKEDIDIELKEDKEYFSKYSIDYLKKFIKAEKLVGSCEISFSFDFPLKIEYKIVDTLLLSFILAPRGED